MGIRDIFDSNADLSELLESPEALFVSQVFHKAFISVDEEGAEAAAATGTDFERVSLCFQCFAISQFC